MKSLIYKFFFVIFSFPNPSNIHNHLRLIIDTTQFFDFTHEVVATFIILIGREICFSYQLGGIALAVCPKPRLGRVPNHDIFHSKVSCNNRSSSGEKCKRVATALVK